MTALVHGPNQSVVRWQLLTFNAIQPDHGRVESMNISLPEPLKEFVDRQIASGRYSSASEYIRELIRGDEKRKAEERLEALLLEGLQGEETELTRDDWTAIRQEARARIAANKKRGR